jgi:hypothetical protein
MSKETAVKVGESMIAASREQLFKIVLVVFGLTFIFGLYSLTYLWPSGWAWGVSGTMHFHHMHMLYLVYATLGVFLILAAQDPAQHRSLIGFTAWSSLVHAAVMSVQAYMDPMERGHFLGDVPALIIVAIVLLVLMPSSVRARQGFYLDRP